MYLPKLESILTEGTVTISGNLSLENVEGLNLDIMSSIANL